MSGLIRGPAPLPRIERRRRERGAHCLTCGWLNEDANRQRAMKHARDERHAVQFLVEEVTTYHGKAPR